MTDTNEETGVLGNTPATTKRKPPAAGRGRPKGSKNKTTIFKEVMQNGFERELRKNFKGVLRAVIDKAKGGDMAAAKLLLDRVVPTSRAVDPRAPGSGRFQVNINVSPMNDPDDNGGVTVDAEFETIDEEEAA